MRKIELIKGTFVAEERIEYSKESVVSQVLVRNSSGNITLFSFDEGQCLSEHTAPFDAVVQVLDGEAKIHIEESVYIVKKGEMIIMPANIPHALYADCRFKMLLTMIKGQ